MSRPESGRGVGAVRRPRREEEAYRCPRCGFEAGSGHGLAMHLKHVCGKEQEEGWSELDSPAPWGPSVRKPFPMPPRRTR